MSKILKVVGASWLRTKISSYILGIIGIFAILALFIGQMERVQADGNYAATVFYSNKTGYRIEFWGQSNKLEDIPRGAARAYFRKDTETTGWSLLEVETDPSYADEHQAYAAGILEGALTWSLIHSHLDNTIRAKCDGTPLESQCNKLKDALDKAVDIWKARAAEKSGEDPFWHQVSLYYTQLNGIHTGWKHGIERRMEEEELEADISDLYWLNAGAEIVEIQRKLNISLGDEIIESVPDLSSAFLRLGEDASEDGILTKKLYLSHNSAGRYSSMTRILKRYKLNYHKTPSDQSYLITGTTIDFSGYPGSLTSQDEFYMVQGENHRMGVTGTALRNYNYKLWKEVNITDQLPIGPRVMAANHLATNVSSWSHIIATSNSGTASKQWLVVDFNKFDKLHTFQPKTISKKPARTEIVTESSIEKNVRHIVMYRNDVGHAKGVVTLVEQVPGVTHSADISQSFLEQGYWATYGLPFFKNIAEITHVNKMEEMYGKIFSKSESPRALIFKQGYKNATTLKGIISLMRQNNMTEANTENKSIVCENDMECILRDQSYWGVVGVRGDLSDVYKKAYGILDTKVVIGTLNSPTLEFLAISGPPHTEIAENKTDISINKGNLMPIYTELLNNNSEINGIEVRNLIIKEQEKAEEDKQELLKRNFVLAFDWSESEFQNTTREGLPDKWAFEPYTPKWSW